jgi:hypothetical protein
VTRVFTFDTTHHALWAEQVAIERGLGAQVVPAPPGAEALCDLALEVLPEDEDLLVAALSDLAIPYRLYGERSSGR